MVEDGRDMTCALSREDFAIILGFINLSEDSVSVVRALTNKR